MLKLPNFGQTTTAAIAVLIVSNAYLCYSGNRLESHNHTLKTENHLIQKDNQNLMAQLHTANDSILHYREQIKALHQTVLAKIQTAEKRTDELKKELEKHPNWADQPIPADIDRLFQQRTENDHGLSSRAENAPDLPGSEPVPNPQSSPENQ